ncbi:hypothetical protein C8Q78DRAFT_71762 [Trametes maxima]|nr:hypothetical protein C8Q78DRAFT_71762 [Trametes maxima]
MTPSCPNPPFSFDFASTSVLGWRAARRSFTPFLIGIISYTVLPLVYSRFHGLSPLLWASLLTSSSSSFSIIVIIITSSTVTSHSLWSPRGLRMIFSFRATLPSYMHFFQHSFAFAFALGCIEILHSFGSPSRGRALNSVHPPSVDRCSPYYML